MYRPFLENKSSNSNLYMHSRVGKLQVLTGKASGDSKLKMLRVFYLVSLFFFLYLVATYLLFFQETFEAK